jgi:hypothetical protein
MSDFQDKPSSAEIKNATKDTVDAQQYKRWLYVHELRTLLEGLEDNDTVQVNQIGNINVGRLKDPMYATLDFRWNNLEVWKEEKE